MSAPPFVLWAVLMGLVLWLGRAIPLAGRRRLLVVGCRVAALTALSAALLGLSHRVVQEQPQHVVYLVDHSASMDVQQRAWIARRVASLDALRPAGVRRAVVVFGAEAQLVYPFSQDRLTDPAAILAAMAAQPVTASGTNLEAALLSTVRLLPPGQGGHLVLFSDGRETQGNVGGVLAAARRLGLAVFPEPVPVFGSSATAWESLTIPPVVKRGSPVSLQLVVYRGDPRPITGALTISLAGIPLKRQRVTIRPGWHVLTASVPAMAQGTMALDVLLEIPGEHLQEHRAAYTEVEGPPHLLMVADRPTVLPLLAKALQRREMEVSLARPGDVPTAPLALMDYDAVILFGIPKSSLTAQQVDALRSYTETFGGGVVMVGLGGDLAQEIATAAPLDALLPVQFEAKGVQESKRRVCMIMLIDRSASMIGPRIAATKRAAVELVNQLSPEDLIGIFAFDTQPYIIADVQRAEQLGNTLIEKLVQLRSSGGTDVLPSLLIAQDRLDQTDAKVKHVILLSDGNTPFHRDAYHALARTFLENHISVSTIGIGSAFVNTDFLQWIASSTGGTFYQMRSLEELPTLIARDAQKELGSLPFTEGYFRPERSPTSPWFADVPEWPVLRGYLTTTAKPGAQVDLTVRAGESPDPLLARWMVGQGRVVSFTSDADTRWSPSWIRWPGFDGTWGQIIRWAMRPRLAEELFVWVDEGRGLPQLVLEGELHDPQAELIAADDSTVRPLSLIQTGTWRWEAPLEQVPSGWHQLTVKSQQGTGTTFAKRWVMIGTPPATVETSGQPPREPLLRQMAQATAGAYGVPDRAFVPPTTTATTREPLFMWWLPLVIVLLLVEIALRGASML